MAVNFEDTYEEIIASALVDYNKVEVVKLSYSLFPSPLYLTNQLEDLTEITLPDGEAVKVRNVPMEITGESQDGLVSNTRSLTLQGINDLVAQYDDYVDRSIDERVKAEVLVYTTSRSGQISHVQEYFCYYKMSTDYAQKSNSATLKLSTQPTNESECGLNSSSTIFPSMPS